MRLARIQRPGRNWEWADLRADATAELLEGSISDRWRRTGQSVTEFTMLAPVQPTNLIAVGLNYRRHALEAKLQPPPHPMWFMKTTESIQAPGQPIVLANAASEQVDYEAELAVVLARAARDVRREDAFDYILGYTCANDVSARDWQFQWSSGQFSHSKSFDTFCPLGPVIVTTDEIPDPSGLRIRSTLNGRIMQDDTTRELIFDVPELISFLSRGRTLPIGTVILTGTPAGVGMGQKPPVWLRPGDTVTVEVDGIGTLTNPVVLHRATAEPGSPAVATSSTDRVTLS